MTSADDIFKHIFLGPFRLNITIIEIIYIYPSTFYPVHGINQESFLLDAAQCIIWSIPQLSTKYSCDFNQKLYHTATLQFVMTKYVLLNGLTTALLMDGALLGIILAGRVQLVKMLITL